MTHLTLLVLHLWLYLAGNPAQTNLKEGDILFQSSGSAQAKAIELATHSKFSHVGIVVQKDGKLMVAEAVQPVKFTDLKTWIARGQGTYYEAKRLKDRDKVLTEAVLTKMRAKAKGYAGKNYDLYFQWSDSELYCSELVWKLYKDCAGMEVGSLKKFKDYDFTHPLVKEQLKERFGDNIPKEETIIAPEDIYKSTLLVDVK